MLPVIAAPAQCSSQVEKEGVTRRSGNYKNCKWDHGYIQNTMKNDYADVKYKIQADKLVQRVGVMLRGVSELTEQLDLVDDLHRLGLAYHFKEEIKSILQKIYGTYYITCEHWDKMDLHTAALAFRLLRQHDYSVPQETFKCFMDSDSDGFKLSLCEDAKGMISLYEASYLGAEGESIVGEALDFTTTHLPKLKTLDPYLKSLLVSALELPLRRRPPRSEARWFIQEAYEKKRSMSPLLLQLAKLDFNIVQGLHKEELRELSRWWTKLDFGKELSFARDCVVSSHLWSILTSPEPQYEACRKVSTKLIVLISTIDDIYDVYGTLEELEPFTDAIERWDMSAMNQLPDYMKKCFLELDNTVEEMAVDVLREKGVNVIKSLKKTWITQTRSYMKEARWYHNGHRPTLDEYMDNARFSIGMHLMTIPSHIFDPNQLDQTALEDLETDPDILKYAGIITRFLDDLGTSSDEMARGDVPKSVQCYMNDSGASEQVARNFIKNNVREEWKKLNKCVMENKVLPHSTIERLLNLIKAAHLFYLDGDGHGLQNGEIKDIISKLLFDPIPSPDVDLQVSFTSALGEAK